MQAKVKFKDRRCGVSQTLNFGPGKVRFIYRTEMLVAFEKALPCRHPKEELSKAEPRPALSAAA